MKFRQNSLEFTLTATEEFLKKSEEHFLKQVVRKSLPNFFYTSTSTYNYKGQRGSYTLCDFQRQKSP